MALKLFFTQMYLKQAVVDKNNVVSRYWICCKEEKEENLATLRILKVVKRIRHNKR
ncbi:hypothetical protein Bca101_059006 [Brassica carinata]